MYIDRRCRQIGQIPYIPDRTSVEGGQQFAHDDLKQADREDLRPIQFTGLPQLAELRPGQWHSKQPGEQEGEQEEEKLAVQSGYWPLYRYNPALKAEGKNPFILDSKKPDGSLKEFLAGEIRYASLQRTFPEEAERLHTTLVDQFNKRYEELALMADPTLVCKQEEPVE